MLTHYLKLGLRNILRHKGYSFVSVLGLTLGLASCLAILLFLQDELSYDEYHQKKDRIYRLATNMDGASFTGIAKVNGPWGPTALANLPEVEQMTRFVIAGQTLIEKDGMRFYENDGLYTDSTVFEIFSFDVIKGDPVSALKRPDGIVLTESLARKYFEGKDPLGQALKLNNQLTVMVTAVIKDVPSASHFTFSFLLPMSGYTHPQKESWTQWNQFYTYLLLKQEAAAGAISIKFKELLPKYLDAALANAYHPFLQPLTGIHLKSRLFRELSANSDEAYLYIFSAIGILILIISSINFINLSTARALHRTREVGIRKSSGALKRQLIFQFLSESLVLCFFALVLAMAALVLVLPSFNSIVNKQLVLDVFDNLAISAAGIAVALFVGIAAGSYPAFFLAGLRPAEVLKGFLKISRRSGMREALVVIQFSISALLIIASSVIYNQLSFIQEKDLGFNPTALITIPLQEPSMKAKSETVKQELLLDPAIVSVSFSGNQPGGGDWGIPYVPEGIAPDQIPAMRLLAVDPDFVKTFSLEISAGRDFSKSIKSDSGAYIINEEAARQLGWNDPIGKLISMPAIGRTDGPIIGVLKDFHFRSLKEKIGPVMLFVPPSGWMGVCTVRIATSKMENGLKAIEKTWATFDGAHPFTYSFFDTTFGNLYRAEKRLGELVGYFTLVAIFIACLGLFSLSSFAAEQRTKEVGIRKVMGASIRSIALLLSRDLIKLVVIGFLIAAPGGYLIMKQWLGDFAYRIEISPLVFLTSAVITLVLAWMAVGYQIVRAGMANPVDSLRSE